MIPIAETTYDSFFRELLGASGLADLTYPAFILLLPYLIFQLVRLGLWPLVKQFAAYPTSLLSLHHKGWFAKECFYLIYGVALTYLAVPFLLYLLFVVMFVPPWIQGSLKAEAMIFIVMLPRLYGNFYHSLAA